MNALLVVVGGSLGLLGYDRQANPTGSGHGGAEAQSWWSGCQADGPNMQSMAALMRLAARQCWLTVLYLITTACTPLIL